MKIWKKITIILCAFTLLGIIYMSFNLINTQNDVFNKRIDDSIKVVKDYKYEKVKSKDCPVGIKRVFTWKINDSFNQSSLAFYVSHSYVKVFIDKELVYSLYPKNSSIKSVGSNHIMIPFYESDKGKNIKIEIEPVYEDFIDKKITFYEGPWQAIYKKELKKDLIQIILAFTSIIIGIILCILSFYYYIHKKVTSRLEFFGIFAICIGIWKITDMEFTPLLYAESSVFITHLSLFALLMAAPTFMIFIKNKVKTEIRTLINIATVISVVVPALSVFLTLFNIFELRELLHINFVAIFIVILLTTITIIKEFIRTKIFSKTNIVILTLFLGVLIDLAVYYYTGSSSYTFSVLIALVVDIIYLVTITIRDLQYQSRIDYLTKLGNNNRCKEIVENDDIVPNNTVFITIDLNGIKTINDLQGHSEGDKVLINFSKILKSCASKNSFVGRWGGDEFIVILYNCDRNMAKKFLKDLEKHTNNYNKQNGGALISYSYGLVYSNDFKKPTMKMLFNKADEKMYINKQNYYKQKNK